VTSYATIEDSEWQNVNSSTTATAKYKRLFGNADFGPGALFHSSSNEYHTLRVTIQL